MPTASTPPVLTLDVGGSKIAVGLVDAGGTLLRHEWVLTPSGDAEAIWTVAERLIDGVLRGVAGRISGVGIASAGPVDLAAGTVSPINVAVWQGFPIVERVAAMTGAEVRLGGDGLCMALGECWRGAARDARFLLGMVVSTGIGGGLVLDGAPYHGRTGNGGHVGHVVVEPDGATCACGGRGCVETVAAGPRLVWWARDHGWDAPPGADARTLAADARSGNAIGGRAFGRGARALAATIASVAAVCDLDAVVVGGGVAAAGALLFDPLREALRTYAGLSFIRGIRVAPAALGGAAGLVGAAKLAFDET